MTTLSIKDLTIAVPNKTLFHKLNVDFSAGQIWGLIGPNGAGKTTLLHTLAGLHKQNEGQILLNNIPIHHIQPRYRAQKIGVLLQQDMEFSFPSAVLEIASTGRYPHQNLWSNETDEDIKIAKQSLAKMKLTDFENRSVTSLSGGEKRRLNIATLLTQNPDIYLLDEPTNHFEIKYSLQTFSLLQKLAKEQQKIIIMISHDIHLIKTFCDQIILLGFNQEKLIGSCREILTDKNLDRFFG